jgi:spectinomycin phosphotransferase
MLEPPDLSEQAIVGCLRRAYGLTPETIRFLPLGADQDTAVYRAEADDGGSYFVKLRRGDFVEASVRVPHWLREQGVAAIIPPQRTLDGELWTHLAAFTIILYPFVEGHDAHGIALSEQQWRAFGDTLRRIHAAELPVDLLRDLPRESFSPYWRDQVRVFLSRTATEYHDEPYAAGAARLLRERKGDTEHCVARAEALAGEVARLSLPLCLCHSDIHPWNVLLDSAGRFFIVDWDTLIYAPKERDLMFVGGGIGDWDSAEEVARFYRGYGEVEVNRSALAYYRYDRIVQDIAAYCEALLLTDEGGADREEMLHQLESNFMPGGPVEFARATEWERGSKGGL